MGTSVESLWPKDLGVKPIPGPVKILREQSAALEELTGNRLYSEVLEAGFPSTTGIRFNFSIGVTSKPYRHNLLAIECGLLHDYPVTIKNLETESEGIASNEEQFRAQIRSILTSETTKELLSRLLTFATK